MDNMTPSVDISNTSSPAEWKYLNEGGANTVYGYRNRSDPIYGNKVLRIPKVTPLETNVEQDRSDARDTFETLLLPALLDRRFLPERQWVIVSSEWLAGLEQQEAGARPTHRTSSQPSSRNHAEVEGTLMKNLIGGDGVIAVEIKPKWGFLPCPYFLSAVSLPVKTRHCRFCLHQHYKSLTHESPSLGRQDERYCPLDLYSGDVHRVDRAVDSLRRRWENSGGIGNNLRIYRDGVQIRPDMIESRFDMEGLKRAMVETVMSSNLFKDLSRLQRTLDPIDIEGLQEIYHTAKGEDVRQNGLVVFNEEEPSAEELKTLFNKLDRRSAVADNTTDWSLRELLLAYAVSATFKDCSVIIRYRRIEPCSGVGISTNQLIQESATIIDLDLKPMSNLNKWAKLDRAIWQAYLEHPPKVETTCQAPESMSLAT